MEEKRIKEPHWWKASGLTTTPTLIPLRYIGTEITSLGSSFASQDNANPRFVKKREPRWLSEIYFHRRLRISTSIFRHFDDLHFHFSQPVFFIVLTFHFTKVYFHMIVRIVPVVSKNVQTIGTIIWKRYPDDRKRPGRLRRPRSLV